MSEMKGGGVNVVTVDDVEIFVSSHNDTSFLVSFASFSQPSHVTMCLSVSRSLLLQFVRCSFKACGIFFLIVVALAALR
jgi:hypothetical protein